MRQLSLSAQSALNIIASIVVVGINVIINFLLSPYIVAHLGVEANGYITLANNFVSYIALVEIALNSMCGRFILLDFRRGNLISAKAYYSSVLLGNWILALCCIVPMSLFVVFIDRFINVPPTFLWDTRVLFAIVFCDYIIQLCFPKWQVAIYCTNNLYLRSIKNAVTSIVRAVTIYLLFRYLAPHSYYVAIAATIMIFVGLSMDYWFYRELLPELNWKIAYFQVSKVKELITSGIWNTVSQCGNLLFEGLDILIANIFINPVVSGVLALSKVIPNMINQVTGTIATTYGPRLTYLFADGDKEGMVREVKNEMLYVSIIANLPIGMFLAFGRDFFSLWVPSQDATLLFQLSCCSLLGMLFMGITQCVVNIFGVVNRLRLNSIVIIGTGVVNILLVYIFLRFTSIGVYAIALVSSVVSIVRIFTFTLPYGAMCIGADRWVFVTPVIKYVSMTFIPFAVGYSLSLFFNVTGWLSLIVLVGGASGITALIDYYVVLNTNQRRVILQLLHIKV